MKPRCQSWVALSSFHFWMLLSLRRAWTGLVTCSGLKSKCSGLWLFLLHMVTPVWSGPYFTVPASLVLNSFTPSLFLSCYFLPSLILILSQTGGRKCVFRFKEHSTSGLLFPFLSTLSLSPGGGRAGFELVNRSFLRTFVLFSPQTWTFDTLPCV